MFDPDWFPPAREQGGSSRDMANEEIIVTQRGERDGAAEFDVEIRGGDGRSTTHIVTVPWEYFTTKFSDAFVSPGELVEASFRFLLAREPKEAILPEFALPLISRYFPDYEQELLGA